MATTYLPLRWHIRAGARDVALERLPVLNHGYGTEAGCDWDGEGSMP